MRLTRRRRRSLHDLDVGNADYTPFDQQVEEALDGGARNRNIGNWLDRILADNDARDRARRRMERQRPVDNPAARNAMMSDELVEHAAQALANNARDTIDRETRRILGVWPDPPPARRVVSGLYRDVLQMTRRVSTRQARITAGVISATQNILRREMHAYIQNHFPGTFQDWSFTFDIGQDSFNEEAVITIIARRP